MINKNIIIVIALLFCSSAYAGQKKKQKKARARQNYIDRQLKRFQEQSDQLELKGQESTPAQVHQSSSANNQNNNAERDHYRLIDEGDIVIKSREIEFFFLGSAFAGLAYSIFRICQLHLQEQCNKDA